MKATFEIKKAGDGKFVFNLKAVNEQVILTSQTYETKQSAESGIASAKQNANLDERYEEKTGSDGLLYFLLHAANKQVIGRSQNVFFPRGPAQRDRLGEEERARGGDS